MSPLRQSFGSFLQDVISPRFVEGGGGAGGGSPAGSGRPLRDLVAGVTLADRRGSLQVPIRNIITDSRRVGPGSLFVARPGQRTDGRLFVEEAIDRGATAVLSEDRPGLHKGVTFLQVADLGAALARLAGNFYNWPDRDLRLVGITGTNGKTTVAWLVHQFLAAARPKARSGLIGTIHYDLGGRTVPAYRTTPESVDTVGLLRQMAEAGCDSAVMEVSSHGLAQGRVDGLAFDTAVFLNLTRDHLDYHRDMESYYRAKRKLFDGSTGHRPGRMVLPVDEPYGRRLREDLGPVEGVVTYGVEVPADYRAEEVEVGREGLRFRLVAGDRSFPVQSPLAGRFNVRNLLAALAVAGEEGLDLAACARFLRTFPGVPGRLERVGEPEAGEIFVDYAHTDDALRNVLETLREITPGRLLLVFGCGGDRDRSKRPLMTHVAQTYADEVWATADNPRSEDLGRILADMERGVSRPEAIRFVEDRREALSEAIDALGEGDTLLVAGKGHEPFMEFASTVVPFDDRQVVRELLSVKRMRSESAP